MGHHGYHFFYPRFLEPLRAETFTMLEIGYFKGASMNMWHEYFPHATLYAMEITHGAAYENYTVIKGDQSKPEDLKNVKEVVGSARFIIDDGSHNPVHQMDTFCYLFENLLEPGGIYIIEDIELSYWNPKSSLYGYQVGNFSLIENMKKLHDRINGEFTGIKNTWNISTISYGQNCVIVTKQTQEEAAYFDRNYRFKFCTDESVCSL